MDILLANFTEGKPRMMIKKIVLSNSASFYGKHVLRLEEGLNFVVGPGGSGKTNLARAFMFAVLGYSDVPKKDLINYKHCRECSEKYENPFCLVEVEMRQEDRDYLIQGGLSLNEGKELIQSLKIDSDLDRIVTSETWKLIHLNERLVFEEDRNYSHTTRTTPSVIKHLSRNIKSCIKMAILDGILDSLAVGYREKLLSAINELGLEQLTIMVKYLDQLPKDLEDRSVKMHYIDFDRENSSSKFVPHPSRYQH